MSAPRDSLLPANATPLERAVSLVSARLLDAPVRVIRTARVGASAPTALLFHLAWEHSVHHPTSYELAMRARIDSSFEDHLTYGSPAALEEEIALDTGLPVRILEFWERPYLAWPEFLLEVIVEPDEPTPAVDGAWRSAVRRKNVRDWPARARVAATQPSGALYVGAATHVSPRVRILPDDTAPSGPQIHIGAATRTMPRVRILPMGLQ